MFYIYTINDFDNNVIYVGRTNNIKRRTNEHKRDINKKNYRLYYKLRKILESDSSYQLKLNVVCICNSYEESLIEEIEFIKYYKSKGFVLTNLTDGGDGISNAVRIFTDEWKNNLKLSAKKRVESKGIYNKGLDMLEYLGEERYNEIYGKIGDKISEGIRNGTIKHNKGISLNELVGEERASEIKQKLSENAQKRFSGSKQNPDHIKKRMARHYTKYNISNGIIMIDVTSTKTNLTDIIIENFNVKIDRNKISKMINNNETYKNITIKEA